MKPIFSLIAMLLLTALVHVGYMCYTNPSLLNPTSLPPALSSLLPSTSSLLNPTDLPPAPSSLLPSTSSPSVPSLDTTSQRVLIVGDSMVERLRRRMARYCHASGHELTSVIWYSSSTEWWAQCDTLSYFIRQVQPTHIYICLGGNELYVRDLDKRAAYIDTMLAQCGTIPTVWIGPPNWCEDTGINALIERKMPHGAYYPSYKLTFQRARDGHHPTQASADMWMDSIAAWTQRLEPLHPIRYQMPADESAEHPTYILAPHAPE